MSDVNLLTVFVDASRDHETSAGGYGAWAKHGGMRTGLLFGGHIRNSLTPTDAEIQAVRNALYDLWNRGEIPKGCRRVLVQTDSTTAISAYLTLDRASQSAKEHKASDHRPMFRSETLWSAVQDVEALLDALDLKLILRHVYGHRVETTTRYSVQARCDEIAYENMRNERRRLSGGKRRQRKPKHRRRKYCPDPKESI